ADFQKIRCWLAWPGENFHGTYTQKRKLGVIRQITVNNLAVKYPKTIAAAGTLQQLIHGIAGGPVDVKPGATLEDDLNLNSLDRVELMSAIEDRYQVDLRDREFSQVSTVADLEELVKKSSARTRSASYPYSPWAQRWPVTWLRLLVYYLLV